MTVLPTPTTSRIGIGERPERAARGSLPLGAPREPHLDHTFGVGVVVDGSQLEHGLDGLEVFLDRILVAVELHEVCRALRQITAPGKRLVGRWNVIDDPFGAA